MFYPLYLEESDTDLIYEMRRRQAEHEPYLRQKAYGDFIARWPWEWFVTFTFTEDVHRERAFKLYLLWASKLNRDIYGARWYKRGGCHWVFSFERQKSGRWHIHALMAGVKDSRRLTWMDKWVALDRVAGWARIEPVQNQIAVSKYVTKYVSKDGRLEFSKNLRDITRDLASPEFGSLTNPCTAVAKLAGK